MLRRSTSKKRRKAARVSLRPKPSGAERDETALDVRRDELRIGAHVVGGSDRQRSASELLLDVTATTILLRVQTVPALHLGPRRVRAR
jgi:hypothetical protein